MVSIWPILKVDLGATSAVLVMTLNSSFHILGSLLVSLGSFELPVVVLVFWGNCKLALVANYGPCNEVLGL